jgi:hypothetical protein
MYTFTVHFIGASALLLDRHSTEMETLQPRQYFLLEIFAGYLTNKLGLVIKVDKVIIIIYIHTCLLLTYVFTYILKYILTYLLSYLLYLLTYILTYLLTYLLSYFTYLLT